MEQKAVTYKTIKGMARDMAASSGSNDFSYENYNIRITTRGKEDSLVVTNEKGTESNIIASRNVTKTVNTIFEGLAPDFYTNEQHTTVDKTPTILSSLNDTVSFGYNVEYPIPTLGNELLIKSRLSLTETPITVYNNQYYLIDDGNKELDFDFTIGSENINQIKNQTIKDIVLGGESGYYKTNNQYDAIDDVDYEDSDEHLPTNEIKSHWLPSYKQLFDILTERKFNFYNFNTLVDDYTFVNSDVLEYLYQSTNSGLYKKYPYGQYKADEYYANSLLTEEQVGSTNYYRVTTKAPRLSFINGLLLSNKYPYGTSLSLQEKSACNFYMNVYSEVSSDEEYQNTDKVYKRTSTDFVYYGTYADISSLTDKSGYYVSEGYIKFEFDFNVKEFITTKNSYLKKNTTSITTNINDLKTSGDNVGDIICYLEYSTYTSLNTVPALGITIKPYASQNWSYVKNTGSPYYDFLKKTANSKTYYIQSGGGPFLKQNVVLSTDGVKIIVDGEQVNNYNWDSINNDCPDFNIGSLFQLQNTLDDQTITTYSFNDVYKFKDFEANGQVATNGDTIKTTNGINFYRKPSGSSEFSSTIYYCKNYSILQGENSKTQIESIISKKSNNNELIEITIAGTGGHVLEYNPSVNSGIITDTTANASYKMYKITSDYFLFPFIAFIPSDANIGTGYSSGATVYTFSSGVFTTFTGFTGNYAHIVKSDMTGVVNPCISTSTNAFKLFKKENAIVFGSSENNIFAGTSVNIERMYELPIFETNEYGYEVFTINNETEFNKYKEILYTESSGVYSKAISYSDSTTYYIRVSIPTYIKSDKRILYVNPTYDKVLNNELFKFYQSDFSFSLNADDFRLKYSNSNWDNKYVYQLLDDVDDNADYIRDDIYPLYFLDNTLLKLVVKANDDSTFNSFKIETENTDKVYFNAETQNDIYVTIKDKNDSTYSKRDELANFLTGVTDVECLNNHLVSRHSFYISDIESFLTTPTGLRENDIDQEIKNNFINDNEEGFYKDKIEYKSLIDDNNYTYIQQIYNDNGYITTSTIRYDFSMSNYKNKFFSVLDFCVLVSCYGEYHAITIPGRILGSCTIEEYSVLFFHYSSPALKYYKLVDGVYSLVENNVSDEPILYTKRRGEKNVYDLAVKDKVLLRDENNDYINGKNKDYIVRLKYINAKPDNKENEWVKIVDRITNAATQTSLSSIVIEKKPYYAAEILWSGDLGFNANNGIETIGYYESKNVIKVYFTDGKNQPRMINIMTPRSKRGYGDTNYTWDNKTFDFIQEISGSEKYKVVKQYGGGAFPAGTVQYYFTYSNLGGCETNPFVCTPVYYTSEQDKGNAVTNITDNTFKITLYNLSTRFDYVNIYSVIRTSKDLQPLCKRVINISMKNHDRTITFTDNNLLGEVIDSTYLLMLQGTPISALTMAEKDNTLFLGNINKLTENLTQDEKAELKNCFVINQKTRRYQNYNPNEDEWYENIVEEATQYDVNGNIIRDNDGNIVKKPVISLGKNSADIKTFMYNEYYRLGIQLQDKFGKWSDPVFIEDIKCESNITNRIKYEESQDDGTRNVTNLQSFIPYFDLRIANGMWERFVRIINKHEFKKIRPVIVYPNISSRNVLCQGLLSPTMFNYADRSVNGPFNFSSYYFRPYPPAISDKKDENGNYKFDVDVDVRSAGGYPIEYRHGYPITGYHDAIEESLANGESGETDLSTMVANYLSSRPVTSVKLSPNTPGWWIAGATYIREGVIEFNADGVPTFKKGCKIYKVSESTNKGHINYAYTLEEDKPFVVIVNSSSSEAFANNITKWFGGEFIYGQGNGTGVSKDNDYTNAIGFSSHMHYFKNKLLNLGAMFLSADVITTTYVLADGIATGAEIIKKISDTEFAFGDGFICFNEGAITYKAYYPLSIKILPLSDIRKQKHRGLKRKTYYCDITVTASRIELSSTANGDKYIDNPGTEQAVAKKAYFAYNNGEIACANGNKNYNIFKGSVIKKVDDTYDSSEINISSRKQSLFYVDESVCTLNSPDIEYDPTVQKIDLSNYRLNVVGAANITGYKNNIQIDTETPPSAFGTIVGQGFRHEPFEIQNFNTEAYRYMLSGAYWYDSFFNDAGDEGEKPNDDSRLLSDQYCWWVYPFNRQILNNSREGQYGKLRTKKWVNYHYSAFSDYFGDSSAEYDLIDAQQIYDVHQAVNIDTVWQKEKAIYFGSVDTAYTNPVPLCGVLGGSNAPEENAYEQSLAVSPHCTFKAGNDSYSSANLADIIPFSYNSSNHFVLSLKQYDVRKANVFPKYYSVEDVLQDVRRHTTTLPTEERYIIVIDDKTFYTTTNPVTFLGVDKSDTLFIFNEEEDESVLLIKNMSRINSITGDIVNNYYWFKYNNISYKINDASVVDVTESGNSEFVFTDDVVNSLVFKKINVIKQEYIDYYDDFNDVNDEKTLEKEYTIPASLILDSTKPTSCIERYIQYNDIENGNVKQTGIYDYGHVYIAQLERGVQSADEVFSGTEESVLLQNTWIPAGESLMIYEFKTNGLKYTEGDAYYQRYDCMKTYAHNSMDINQNIEVLSAMIQTRVNLDGVYSYRGTVDNVDMNNTNTNLLNTAYSQSDNYFTYSITNSYISDITEYSNMFTWTLTKQPMSSTDNWMAINLIAYYNATGSFGKITRIINYRNSLFCFQNNAISQIAYNERVALTPSDGVPIEIGNSGKVQGLNYISSNVGCQNRWSVVSSKGFLYWVDDRRAEIYRFGEGLEPFSTAKGFSDWVKENTYGEDWKPIKSTNVPITAYYDNNNDDIYFVTEKDCLAYNEKIDAFESFFSYEDSFILNSAGNTLVIKEQDSLIKENSDVYIGDPLWNNGIRGDGLSSIELMHEGEYNRFFGVQMPYYIRFKVYPTDLQRDKIYTNLEFNTDAFNYNDYYMPDDTFTRVRIWDEYQWGEWEIGSPLYGTTAYKRRFRTHYLQLPRASYYPNGYYDNYNKLFYRQPMWNRWATGATIDSRNLVLTNINASNINDRIRNPWCWLEVYKENNDFSKYTIPGETFAQRESNYFKDKANLFIKQYTLVSVDDWNNYKLLYKAIYKYVVVEVTEETFDELKSSLYIKDNDEYERVTGDYDSSETYYQYVIDKYEEEANNGSDRNPSVTEVTYANRNNYDLSELYYEVKQDVYEKASQDMYDNENITLYKLIYNELYSMDYINCANIYKFADDVDYYKLVNDNNRIEIHDIILKYFEA